MSAVRPCETHRHVTVGAIGEAWVGGYGTGAEPHPGTHRVARCRSSERHFSSHSHGLAVSSCHAQWCNKCSQMSCVSAPSAHAAVQGLAHLVDKRERGRTSFHIPGLARLIDTAHDQMLTLISRVAFAYPIGAPQGCENTRRAGGRKQQLQRRTHRRRAGVARRGRSWEGRRSSPPSSPPIGAGQHYRVARARPGRDRQSTLLAAPPPRPARRDVRFSRPIWPHSPSPGLRLRSPPAGDPAPAISRRVVDSAELCPTGTSTPAGRPLRSHDHPARQSQAHRAGPGRVRRRRRGGAGGRGTGRSHCAGARRPAAGPSCLARYRSGPRLGRRAGLPPLAVSERAAERQAQVWRDRPEIRLTGVMGWRHGQLSAGLVPDGP